MKEPYNRLHGLDFCRAVFMVLGLFYHAGLIYGYGNSWNVVSDERSQLISFLANFVHMFRMEAFYLISGFFYMLVFSKSKPNFLSGRLVRVAVPLFFCGLFINPVMHFFSYNKSFTFDLNYFYSGQWLGHLWFLGNLLIYFFLTYFFCGFFYRVRLGRFSLLLVLFFILPVLSLTGLAIAKFIYDGNFIFVSFYPLFYYFPYFLIGIICFVNKDIFVSILNIKYAVLSFFVFLTLYAFSSLDSFSSNTINNMVDVMYVGSLVIFLIALVYMLGCRESFLIKELSDASYTIYILHQPLLIFFYVFLFSNIYLGAITEYLLLVSSVFFISWVFHFSVVKRSNIARLLFNGHR
ncbi:acyltransferase family protein [Leucothrix arctica]|uniref:Acyltransferase 3 domain-containing protein n=1 Tax=Leucothrix arctica TaxID=1481894 RepID=A0A317CKK3_9GAMM|nr:acyltransferase family protein [Leucothrix arctica]PWQ98717.1 hypothetical protein DKT75_02590 [Leucothrix arctica]